MNYTLLIFSTVFVVLVTFRFLVLQKPFWLYIPGVVATIVYPLADFRPIEWRVSAQISEGQTDGIANASPNIIFIISDDLGFNDLSLGNAGVKTPNIDSIASNGVKFTSAYSGHATCAPSRASIFTGRYATRFGFEFTPIPMAFSFALSRPSRESVQKSIFHSELIRQVPTMADMVVPSSEIMISDLTKQMKYSTVYLGKWHLGEAKGFRPQDRGYDETLAILKGASLYYPVNHPSVITARVGGNLDDFLLANLRSAVQFNGGRHFEPDEYMTDYLANQAAAAIRAKGSTPLFMTVSFNAPHSPFQAKLDDYESPEIANITHKVRRVYAAMVKALDRGVGTILKAVEESGKADNTLIIFTSDNGGPGTNYMPEINAPFRGWKATLFEGGVRVPFLMQWPNKIPAGVVYDRPISHVDMFATAAVAAGVSSMEQLTKDLKRQFDGVDLVEVVRRHVDSGRPSKDKILSLPWQHQGDSGGNREGSLPTATADADPHNYIFWRTGHYIALRTGDWKLQVSDRPNKVWFFDLAQDPTERTNLAAGILWSELRSSKDVSAPDDATLRRIGAGTDQSVIAARTVFDNSKNCSNNECHFSTDPLEMFKGFFEQAQAKIIPIITAAVASPTFPAEGSHHSVADAAAVYTSSQIGEAVDSACSRSLHNEDLSKSLSPHDRLVCVARLLIRANAEQSAPLWPALAEIPVPVDGMGYAVTAADEEYIYWSN